MLWVSAPTQSEVFKIQIPGPTLRDSGSFGLEYSPGISILKYSQVDTHRHPELRAVILLKALPTLGTLSPNKLSSGLSLHRVWGTFLKCLHLN